MPPVGDAGPKAPYLPLSGCADRVADFIKSELNSHAIVAIQPSDASRSCLGLARLRSGHGDVKPQTAAPARQSRRPEAARQGSVRAGVDADRGPGALDRLLLARLSGRSEGAAGRRRILAGRAPVAQSHVGESGDDRLPRALLAQGEG